MAEILTVTGLIQPILDAASLLTRAATGGRSADVSDDYALSASASGGFGELFDPTSDSSADAVRTSRESLNAKQHALLVAEHPELVGSTNGVPIELLDAANRILIERALEEAQASSDTERTESLQAFLVGDRQFLLFDSEGDAGSR